MKEFDLFKRLEKYLVEEIRKTSMKYSDFLSGGKDFAILKSRADTYYDVLNHIKSFENEVDENILLEQDIVVEEPPFFYNFVVINSKNREDFIVKSDVLITQSNISDINKKFRVFRKEENDIYGVERIYDSENQMDYELLNGDFIQYEK